MNHAGNVAEFEFAEELVEDLEVLVDVFCVVGCRGKALGGISTFNFHSLFSFQPNFAFSHPPS